jgi:hypothetical protein
MPLKLRGITVYLRSSARKWEIKVVDRQIFEADPGDPREMSRLSEAAPLSELAPELLR